MKIGVAICTFQRPRQLERLLLLLANMNKERLQGAEIRFLVVDNFPDGQVCSVCDRVAPLLPYPLELVEEKLRGRTFARNRAAREAIFRCYDFLAFIDDDDTPELNWLEELIAAQRQVGAQVVCGAMVPDSGEEDSPVTQASPLFDPPHLGGQTKYGIPSGIGTFNALVSVEVFRLMEEAGELFSEEFTHSRCEDTEFFARASRLGVTFAVAPNSIVKRHFGDERTTLAGLLSYARRMGRYNMLLLRKHAEGPVVRRRWLKALRKVVFAPVRVTVRVRSRAALVRFLYGLAREFGILIS